MVVLSAARLLFLTPPYGRSSLFAQRLLLLIIVAIIGLVELIPKPRTEQSAPHSLPVACQYHGIVPTPADRMRGRYIIWDFDGTLAYRDGAWSGTLAGILRRNAGA